MEAIDEMTPVAQISKIGIEQLNILENTLPDDPKSIAATAVSNGPTLIRLACCTKLIKQLKNVIPSVDITASETLNADKMNNRFEEELTVSTDFGTQSITTIFSCALAAIGFDAARKFSVTPESVNPFSQCLRVVFRYVWYLRCRFLVLNGIQQQNYLAVAHNALRLVSFPIECFTSQRAALYVALRIPDKINLQHFAYSLPHSFKNDAVIDLYDSFISSLSPDKQKTLSEIQDDVQALIQSKETPMFFSSTLSVEDSLCANLVCDIDDIGPDKCHEIMRFFLYEISPDKECKRFMKHFLSACQKATKLQFKNTKRRFDLSTIVVYQERPKNDPDQPVEQKGKKDPLVERKKQPTFSLMDMFKPPRDFISETKNIRVT